jgi:hypothetical protein
MAPDGLPPELTALRAAITAFLDERRRRPRTRRQEALLDIREVQSLLQQAANQLGVILTTRDDE